MVHAYMAENSKAGEQNQRPPRAAKLKPKEQKAAQRAAVKRGKRRPKGPQSTKTILIKQNKKYQDVELIVGNIQ